eukprot:gene31100-39019_t
MPVVAEVRAVSIWLNLDPQQPNQATKYLVDAKMNAGSRLTTTNHELYFTNSAVGTQWEKLYVNGALVNISWPSLVAGSWMHVHLQSNGTFSHGINLMSAVIGGDEQYSSGNLKGCIDSTYLWGREVSASEVEAIVSGVDFNFAYTNSALLAFFNMEERKAWDPDSGGQYVFDYLKPGDTEHWAFLANKPEWVHVEPALETPRAVACRLADSGGLPRRALWSSFAAQAASFASIEAADVLVGIIQDVNGTTAVAVTSSVYLSTAAAINATTLYSALKYTPSLYSVRYDGIDDYIAFPAIDGACVLALLLEVLTLHQATRVASTLASESASGAETEKPDSGIYFAERRSLVITSDTEYVGSFRVDSSSADQYVDGETFETLTCREACARIFGAVSGTNYANYAGSTSNTSITETCYGDIFEGACDTSGSQRDNYE